MFSLAAVVLFVGSSLNLNATTKISEEDFDDCLDRVFAIDQECGLTWKQFKALADLCG